MQKGVRFRIYPNREQKNLIGQTLGCCRLIYNKGLADGRRSKNPLPLGMGSVKPTLITES